MIKLTDIETWEKLDGPYGNSEEVPPLIQQLSAAFSTDVLDEICWEYIYHQQSLYQVTFAAIPYLIAICEKLENPKVKLELFLNVGIILSELDKDSVLLRETFKNSKLDDAVVKEIIEDFQIAFQKLKPIAKSLYSTIIDCDETEKRYFLSALATANQNFTVGKIFITYIENEEYRCNCPECDTEFYLWNKNDMLILYTEDPVFNEEQTGYGINPIEDVQALKEKHKNSNFEWLTSHIEELHIDSLQSIIKYLFGQTSCPECKTKFQVFDGISESL